MNKIFIAKNFEGYAQSIVIAPNQRDACLYWQGKNLIPHQIVEIDPNDFDTPLGILEILKTKDLSVYQNSKHRDYIVVCQG